MAKIKIQSNASGTGVVTLTAPNTNSDRTITLPDGTTTLATVENFTSTGIDDNATSTAITIDSSENVKLVGDEQELRFHSNYSIGNTDRAKIKAIGAGGGSGYGGDLTFHTKNPSNVYSERMRIDSSGNVALLSENAVGSTRNIELGKPSDLNTGGVTLQSYRTSTSGANHDFIIKTVNGGVSTERMRIDSAGRVTMPYQPAFSVTNSSDFHPNGNAIVTYNQALVDVGSNVNLSTGTFTAPVTGLYYFSFTGVIRSKSNYSYGSFLKNGSPQVTDWHTDVGTSEYDSRSIAQLVSLSTNDTFSFKLHESAVGDTYLQASRFTFNGYLIG